jgi:hypothetical protein
LGWALDLYDLLILLYVAPVVGRLFFPASEPLLSLAAVFASFAVSLIMRPLGSALFGSYADRRGRKGALALAVSVVGVATFLLGVLPTVQQIGIAAPIIFVEQGSINRRAKEFPNPNCRATDTTSIPRPHKLTMRFVLKEDPSRIFRDHFGEVAGTTAATPSGLMLKARKVNGSLPRLPHWWTRSSGS